MCGIAGFLEFDRSSATRDHLLSMQEKLIHRGPNGKGDFFKPGIGIAHTRLAILDLTDRARQPMLSDRYVIAYNGEIFNFHDIRKELISLGMTFDSDSDTEVILRGYERWGKDILHRLTGMFAFVIYDRHEKSLFCARDRAGVKPFYFSYDSRKFIFGSELKAIHQYPGINRDISSQGLRDYLRLGFTTGTQTIWKDCYRLLPGQCLEINARHRHPEPQSFWSPSFQANRDIDFPEAVEKTEQLLRQDFAQSMISDVPVGICLSGGVDSNVLTALLADQKNNLRTYSLGSDEARFDENAKAEAVANHLGTKHHSINLKASEISPYLVETLQHYDEPVADQNALSLRVIARQARTDNIPVLLSGLGGDELFMGYPNNIRAARLQPAFVLPAVLRKRMPKDLFSFSNALYKGMHLMQQRTFANAFAGITGNCFLDDEIDQLLISSEFSQHQDYIYRELNRRLPQTPLEVIMQTDFRVYLPDNGLKISDVSAMAEGVEMRVPFLNNETIQFAQSIPPDVKRFGGRLKAVLRTIEARYLPKNLRIHGKQNFDPFDRSVWLKRHLQELVIDYTSAERLARQDLFKHSVFNKIQDLGRNSQVNVSGKIWNMMVFQIWAEKNL